jgi:enterochelin esterase-like enzyme
VGAFVVYNNFSQKAAKGTLQTETFDSEALNQKMEYAIYLPPGYNDPQNASVRYPVAYLLPDSAGGVRNWASPDLTEQMDELLAKGQVQPMIVVVPQERPGNQTVKGTAATSTRLGGTGRLTLPRMWWTK